MKSGNWVKTRISFILLLAFGTLSVGNGHAEDAMPEKPLWGGLRFVRVLGGPSGSGAYGLYCTIAVHFDKIAGIKCGCLAGSSKQNIKSISSGRAEIGYSFDVDCADALAGRGFFERDDSKVKNIAFLAGQFARGIGFFVRADSPIKAIDELKDKHIALGPRGFGANSLAYAVLDAYGITDENIRKWGGRISRMTVSDACAGLRDKTVDCQAVTIGMTGIYGPHLPLEERFGLRLLPIDDTHLGKIANKYPQYLKLRLPGMIYKSQPVDYPTIGMTVNLVCASNLPDDLVYKLMQVLYSRECRKDIYRSMKGGLPVILENGLMGRSGLPVHPGALKFYRDNGIMGPTEMQITPKSIDEALADYGGQWSEQDIEWVEP